MIRYQRIEDVEADGDIEDGVIDENSVLDIGKNKVTVTAQTYQNYKSALKWLHEF